MDRIESHKISAICATENRLEIITKKLTEKIVAQHDISVQKSIADPHTVQEQVTTSYKEPFLFDDYGWVLGFSFAVPVFICMIIGIFIVGDVRSLSDNILYGLIGGFIGVLIGGFATHKVKKIHERKRRNQEEKGGFVIWITVRSEDQMRQAVALLQKYQATNILVE